MTRIAFFMFCAAVVLLGFYLTSCAALGDLSQVADVARDIEPVVDIVKDVTTADGPRDWWDIATKVLAGVGVIAAGTGGELYRRRRKAEKYGGKLARVELSSRDVLSRNCPDEIIALNDALTVLAESEPEAVELAKLRIFADFSVV